MKKRILFVDDEPKILQGLQRSLRPMKDEWDMDFISSSIEALEEVKKNKYDVVVSDYKMPKMDGIELLTLVKNENPEIKRILLSGQSEDEVFDKAEKIADKYIAKPCSTEELMSIINKE